MLGELGGLSFTYLVVQLLSRIPILGVTPWTVGAGQAPLSMEFSRQEYWSGLLFPTPGDLPDPGIEPLSPVSSALQEEFLPTELSEKPSLILDSSKF